MYNWAEVRKVQTQGKKVGLKVEHSPLENLESERMGVDQRVERILMVNDESAKEEEGQRGERNSHEIVAMGQWEAHSLFEVEVPPLDTLSLLHSKTQLGLPLAALDSVPVVHTEVPPRPHHTRSHRQARLSFSLHHRQGTVAPVKHLESGSHIPATPAALANPGPVHKSLEQQACLLLLLDGCSRGCVRQLSLDAGGSCADAFQAPQPSCALFVTSRVALWSLGCGIRDETW